MKKIVCLVIILISFLRIYAFDFSIKNDDGIFICYSLHEEENAVAVAPNADAKYSGNIVIPSEVEYDGLIYTVTAIDSCAFMDCEELTEITFPNTLKIIKEKAFDSCTSLTRLKLPESLEIIEDYAFSDCNGIAELILPASLQSVGEGGFLNWYALTDLKMENPNVSLGMGAFQAAGLAELIIPKGTTSIGELVFNRCNNLKKIVFPNTIKYLGNNAFSQCDNLVEVKLPESVETIDSLCFAECPKLTKIVLPDSLKHLGDCAFHDCDKLAEIVFPESEIPDIGIAVFGKCPALVEVTLPDWMTIIPYRMFYECHNLEKITFPKSLRWIEEYAFSECTNIKELIFPDSLEYIAMFAFEKCENLKEIIIPESVKELDATIFYLCPNLKKVIIEDSSDELHIHPDCFYESSIESFHIGRNITYGYSYGHNNFKNLKEVRIGNEVTEIPNSAFHNCEELKEMILPRTIEQIGRLAFAGCTGLSELSCKNPIPPDINEDSFFEVNKENCTLIVPFGSTTDYRNHSGWGQFKSIEEKDFFGIAPFYAQSQEGKLLWEGQLGNDPIIAEFELDIKTLSLFGHFIYQNYPFAYFLEGEIKDDMWILGISTPENEPPSDEFRLKYENNTLSGFFFLSENNENKPVLLKPVSIDNIKHNFDYLEKVQEIKKESPLSYIRTSNIKLTEDEEKERTKGIYWLTDELSGISMFRVSDLYSEQERDAINKTLEKQHFSQILEYYACSANFRGDYSFNASIGLINDKIISFWMDCYNICHESFFLIPYVRGVTIDVETGNILNLEDILHVKSEDVASTLIGIISDLYPDEWEKLSDEHRREYYWHSPAYCLTEQGLYVVGNSGMLGQYTRERGFLIPYPEKE